MKPVAVNEENCFLFGRDPEEKSGSCFRSRFPMKNRESSTHALTQFTVKRTNKFQSRFNLK